MDLYLAESFDGGDSWQPNLRLSTVSSDLNRAPLTPGGRMVGDYQAVVPALNFGAPAFAVWVDARDALLGPVRRRDQPDAGNHVRGVAAAGLPGHRPVHAHDQLGRGRPGW